MARDVRVNILGDSRDFSRAVGTAERDARGLESTFSSVSSGFGRMAGGIALGAAGLAVGVGVAGVALATTFIQAAEESQQVTRQTQAVLESMGATAWTSAQQVSELSTALSNQTGIDDELIQSGQNVLLTFGQVQNRVGEGRNIFDRATEAALNMSVALGTDMNAAAMQIGKALNDPIRGLTQLRRVGIQFTESQEDQIRAMVEAGDVAGAQTIMLAELERQFGGSAEAQATASQKLSTMWGNLQEQLGEYLLPVFERVVEWLGTHLPGAIDKAREFFQPFIDKVKEVVGVVVENWPLIEAKISEVFEKIKEQAGIFWGYVEGGWANFGQNLQTSTSGVWTAIKANITGSLEAIRGAAQAIMGVFQGDWSKAWSGLSRIVAGAVSAWLGLLSGFTTLGGQIVDAAWRGITAIFQGAWNRFADWWDGLHLSLPSITLPEFLGGGSFGGWTWDPPPAPRFHGGGIYRAPTPGGEGLAMLRDGEQVLTPGQAANRDGGPVTIILQIDKQEFGRVSADSLDAFTKTNGPLQLRIA